MKPLFVILLCLLGLQFGANAQTLTETRLAIKGNCDMCKATIEKAGKIPGVEKLVWNPETQIAEISYNAATTNETEVLKRIAKAGYDNQSFKATDKAYNKLHACCKYDRETALPNLN